MPPDYSKGKIYKITNDYNDDVYIGSTCDTLVKRFSSHRNQSKQYDKRNRLLYVLMNDIGVERFRIELIEDYPCVDKYQLLQREAYYIRQNTENNLNMYIPDRTVKEYLETYYTTNSEQIKAQKREVIICECGCKSERGHIARHRKTGKHIKLMASKQETQ